MTRAEHITLTCGDHIIKNYSLYRISHKFYYRTRHEFPVISRKNKMRCLTFFFDVFVSLNHRTFFLAVTGGVLASSSATPARDAARGGRKAKVRPRRHTCPPLQFRTPSPPYPSSTSLSRRIRPRFSLWDRRRRFFAEELIQRVVQLPDGYHLAGPITWQWMWAEDDRRAIQATCQKEKRTRGRFLDAIACLLE